MSQSNPAHKAVLEQIAIGELQPDPKNARKHSPAQVRQIAASIEAFGFNTPILVDRDNLIISGHGRLLALQRLGRSHAPVIRLEHLSPGAARAFAIAENRLVETSVWDEDLLSEHFQALSALDLDFSLDVTGFTMAEIDLKIEGFDDDAADDADDAPVDPGLSVVRPGELWHLGDHRLLCGSSLESESYVQLFGDERAAMVFTDPPYNVPISGHVSGKGRRKHREFVMAAGEMSEPDFNAFLSQACRLMAEFSADGSLHYLFMDWRHLHGLLAASRGAYDDLVNICVWAKPNGGMGSLYRSAHELVLVCKKGRSPHQNNVQLGRFGRNRTNVWQYAGANSFLRSAEDADLIGQHPTPKPVQLVADALLDSSSRGDIVMDPFCGSGSTLIAAERTGRRCRAIELDPLYCDLTIRRWQRHSGQQAVREADGASFCELEAEAGR
tara:strand:- start:52551 stop:53873 length:1323 start_codon:yes stop_codon:yes gene_type:complete